MKMALASAGAIFCFLNETSLGLADEHGANAKAHQEQSATAVQQIHAALQLKTVRVNDGNSDDCHKSVERVERRKLKLLLVDQNDTECHLNKNR